MLGSNIPVVKLGIIAVSRDCFPIALSTQRRKNIVQAYRGEDLYECPITVENELDMLKAVEDVKAAGCNALVVFLGNFGPETPETLIAEKFEGPCMFVAAAEGDGRESEFTVVANQHRDVVEVVVLFDGSLRYVHLEGESDSGTMGFHFDRVYIDVVFLGGCHRHRQV